MRCLDQASLIGAARFCGGDGQWPQEGTESKQPAGGGNHRETVALQKRLHAYCMHLPHQNPPRLLLAICRARHKE